MPLAVAKLDRARIVLLGFDARRDEHGQGQIFAGPADDATKPMARCDIDLDDRAYRNLLPMLQARGIEVVNCSPGTFVETFPKAPLADVLA